MQTKWLHILCQETTGGEPSFSRRCKCLSTCSRSGFTLVELIVVVAVIGILCGLILPAVQQAREGARKVQCINQLKEIGVALSNHVTTTHAFPSGQSPRWKSIRGNAVGCPVDSSAMIEILPYLEHGAIANSFNFTIRSYDDALKISLSQNMTARSVSIPAFICPSDTVQSRYGPTFVSYRFNIGMPNAAGPMVNRDDYMSMKGAFEPLEYISPQMFRDGLSQTAGVAERLFGSHSSTNLDTKRDIWFAGISDIAPPGNADQILDFCIASPYKGFWFFDNLGYSWSVGSYSCTWYNHVLPPNKVAADCSLNGAPGDKLLYLLNYVALSSRSFHPGGVSVLFMDGSVRFIKESISIAAWRALGTRDGGEIVDASF